MSRVTTEAEGHDRTRANSRSNGCSVRGGGRHAIFLFGRTENVMLTLLISCCCQCCTRRTFLELRCSRPIGLKTHSVSDFPGLPLGLRVDCLVSMNHRCAQWWAHCAPPAHRPDPSLDPPFLGLVLSPLGSPSLHKYFASDSEKSRPSFSNESFCGCRSFL